MGESLFTGQETHGTSHYVVSLPATTDDLHELLHA